jgi:hypothetical protein
MGDMARRGRQSDRQGENAGHVSLTALQVSYIKYFLQQGWPQDQLAEGYCVGRSTIGMISNGTNWPHIQPFQPIPGERLPVPPPIPNLQPPMKRF